MKHAIWIFLALLTLTACGKDEPAPAAESVPVEPTSTEADPAAVADDPAAEDESASEDEAVEVVEESAGNDSGDDEEPIVLAQAETEAAARTWQFKEGANFTRLVPTQPTVGGPDKIEVAEIFMYSCPHCYDLESYMLRWEEQKDPNVRFERIPAIFNQLAALHARLYYTEEVLARNGKLTDRNAFREMVFTEFHRRGNRLASESAIQRVFERGGIDAETFKKTWDSFEVNQKLRVAQDLARRYGITSVPTVVVNGKYRTDAASAGSYPKLVELIDELTEREGLR